MRKAIVLLTVLGMLASPIVADAGAVVRGRFVVQGPFYWHPFFYPGPFAYGYPGGLTYAYPGPFVSYAGAAPYTYGYPGPYSYGTWEYARPYCFAKPNGYWVCS